MKKNILYGLVYMAHFVMCGQLTDGSIQGMVYDENKNAVEDASVVINKQGKGTFTSADGSYRLQGIESGTIVIKVSKIGYTVVERTIKIGKDQHTVDFTLYEKTEQLGGVTVNGMQRSNQAIVSANRLGVKAIDMPNSTDVVTANIFREQQSLTLGEAITNVSGVFQFNKGYGGTSETFGARGLSLRYLGFMFRDGVRFGTNQSLGTPELQAFERVEIFKGGAAINFGYVSPGATINYVTKKPFFETKGYVSMRTGSYSYYKPSLDVNTELGKTLAIRVVATADFAESFRESVESKRIYTYVAARYKPSEKTLLDVNFDYLGDERPRDFGLPIFEDRIVTGYTTVEGDQVPIYLQESGVQRLYSGVTKDIRDRFLGSPFNNRNSDQLNSYVSYRTDLGKGWGLRVTGGTSLSEFDYVQTGSGFYNQYVLEGNDIRITRTLEQQDWEEDAIGAQANVTGGLNIFGLENKLSFSVDYDHRTQKTISYNSLRNFDEIYLFNRDTKERERVPLEASRDGTTKFRGFGTSFQNLLAITDQLNLLASIRLDIVGGSSKNIYLADYNGRGGSFSKGDSTLTEHDDMAYTPSTGITYKFTQNNALFVSYTNSFRPNTRSYLGEDDEVLPPYYTNQFELGTKNSFADGTLNTNITYYLINDNGYIASPDIPERYVISPGARYRGLEFDFSMRPFEGLFLSANYTYIDAEYGSGGFFKEGTRPQQTPEHQIGFWSKYSFTENFSLNLGGHIQGSDWGTTFIVATIHTYRKHLPS